AEILQYRWIFHLLGADHTAGFARFKELYYQKRNGFLLNACETLIKLVYEYYLALPPSGSLQIKEFSEQIEEFVKEYIETIELLKFFVRSGRININNGPFLELCSALQKGILHCIRKLSPKPILIKTILPNASRRDIFSNIGKIGEMKAADTKII